MARIGYLGSHADRCCCVLIARQESCLSLYVTTSGRQAAHGVQLYDLGHVVGISVQDRLSTKSSVLSDSQLARRSTMRHTRVAQLEILQYLGALTSVDAARCHVLRSSHIFGAIANAGSVKAVALIGSVLRVVPRL